MKLQTQIPLQKQSKNLIDYDSNILLMGSCFVENIGDKFDYYKFQNLQNPFGVLFNSIAIETLVSNAINGTFYSDNDVFFHNEQWHCFDTHSKLSAPSKEDLLQNLNQCISATNKQINKSTHIIITLGTAWVYKHKETSRFVANCHKVPQSQFDKVLLSVHDIVKSLETMVSLIHSENPKATIIFTVSPVRHIKDGFVENTQSKAHLISAIHQIINNQSPAINHQLVYFPSYEIMMDELRDYRFYAQDMLHPNQIAINYIWEKFANVWISEQAFGVMNEVDIIQKGIAHKPFNPNSEAHKAFLESLEMKKNSLKSKIPHISF